MTGKETKKKVLIVDDTPQNIQVLGQILDEAGYQIIVAQNGVQALNTVAKVLPELILLDVMMPEMDGYEACKRLKEDPRTADIPIIFLTAKVETDSILKGFDLGAADYVTKPFNPSELLKRVKTHLDLKESKDKLEISNHNYRELIHILCHDLSNPISFMHGVMELGSVEPDLFNKFNKQMWSAINSSLDIINLVRKMRALEEGKTELELSSVPIKSSVELSLEILGSKLKEKQIAIEIHIDDSLTALVEKISFVNSVLSNLLTNAIKFSNNGSTIILSASKENDRVKVTIKDQGIGMSKSILDNLFNLNIPTSRPGTGGEDGTGFGMPLVQKFIEAFGGEIEIFSEEKTDSSTDHGTEVRLILKSGN
ncbi:MAG: hybrid sensor histidine kinase/response regulator [Spirochaetota bacterium]|nr:hybrid sensor histidine kinase/response regulator [Spirochaetota bacterium]